MKTLYQLLARKAVVVLQLVIAVVPTMSIADTAPAVDSLFTTPLQSQWQQFLQEQNWSEGEQPGGLIVVPGRDIYASSAMVPVKLGLGKPGWVESRLAAFEEAELLAKAKILQALAVDSSASRTIELLQQSVWSEGEKAELRALESVQDKLRRIGSKTLDLAEARLDQSLRELDPDSDTSYEALAPADLHRELQDKFQRKLRSTAFRALEGATTVFNAEAPDGDEYMVLVGVAWSPKLQRLSRAMRGGLGDVAGQTAAPPLQDQLPPGVGLLAPLGTRIMVDEKGEFAVLSFAQAEPRPTLPSRRQSALQIAREIAAERARGQVVQFVREGLKWSSGEEFAQELEEYSDLTSAVEILRRFERQVRSQETSIRLRGLSLIKEWVLEHPVTEQDVVGVVMAWSPSSQRQAQEIEAHLNDAGNQRHERAGADKQESPAGALVPYRVDTSAY